MVTSEIGYQVKIGRRAPFALLADGFELQLTRISPAGACAVAPDTGTIRPREPLRLQLGVEGGPSVGVAADLEAVADQQNGAKRLDLTFRTPHVANAREIAAFVEALHDQGVVDIPEGRPDARQRISDPTRLAALWEILARNQTRAMVKRRPGEPASFLRLCQYCPDRGVLAFDTPCADLESVLSLQLIGHSSLYELPPLRVLQQTSDRVLTEIPRSAVRIRRRASGRVQVDGELHLSFSHPLWPEIAVERTIRDISFRGLSYWCDAAMDLVYPGLHLQNVEVSGRDVAPIRFSARVCAVSPTHPLTDARNGQFIGMALTPATEDDWSRWATIVGDRLYPHTRTSRECGRQLWDVFVQSGYLNLSGKQPRDFQQFRQDFERVSDSLAAHPELGARVSWLSERGVESSVSVNKVYRHSWLGHQMARRSGAMPAGTTPKQALRETFLRAFEMAHADPDSRWFVGYIEATVPWMKAANIDFAQKYVAAGLADVLPFRLREGLADADAAGVPGVDVRAPTAAETALVLDAIAAQRSAAYCEAFDLLPASVDLRKPREDWARAGMRRDRALRVACIDGRPVAAAALEAGEPGLNFFSILDAVRLFVLPAGEALSPDAREDALTALLADAKAWYAAAGVKTFVYYQEREEAPHSDRAGLADLGAGFVWVLSSRLLPEWMEHVYELTSPRAPEP